MKKGGSIPAKKLKLKSKGSKKENQEQLKISKDFISDVTDIALFVRTSADDIEGWNKERIAKSLLQETDIREKDAYRIASDVETQIIASNFKHVTSPLIREIANAKLLEYGFEEARKQYTRLGVPVYDVKKMIVAEKNKDNSNVPHGPEATNLTLAENIKKEYALIYVFSQDVADAHARGDMHLHDLGMVDRPYSFFRNEIITVRTPKGEIWTLSFEQLFEKISSPVEQKDGFEIKKTEGFFTADEKGWTELKRIVRHKAKKSLITINSANGRAVSVTEDHPFIKAEETVNMSKCPKCGSNNVIKNGCRKDSTRSCLCKHCSKNFRREIQKINEEKRKIIDAEKISEKDFIFTPKVVFEKKKKYKSLDLDFAWFLGYFIAEGFYGKNEVAIRSNFIELDKVRKILEKKKIKCGGDNERLRIYSKGFRETLENKFGIRKYAQDKTLPFDFLEYNDKTIAAMVSGIVDGDGTVRTDKYVSEVILRVTSKALVSQIQCFFDKVDVRSYLSSIKSYGVRVYEEKVIESKLPLFSLRFYLTDKQKKLFKYSEKINNKQFKAAKNEKQWDNYSQVRKIEELKNDDEYVYDVTTSSETFISSGVLVHNCSGQSLEYVKKFGLDLSASLAQAKPAKNPQVLLAHMVKFSACLQCHFSGAIGWDAVNLFFAPYLAGLKYAEIKQLAQMLIYEFSQQSVARGGQAIFSDINLYWEIPKHFEKVKAIGPGGKFTGKTYADYEKEAQKFIWALFEVYLEGDGAGRPFFFPKPLLHITSKFFKTKGHEKFLDLACKVAAEKGNTYFVFDRGETAKISQCCRLAFKLEPDDIEDAKKPWKMRYSALQNITINLPRVAYKSGRDEKKLFKALSEIMEITAKAHRQKRIFIEDLLSKGESGPLSFLTINRDGNNYYRIQKASHLIGMVGLNELVKYFMGEEMHESKAALKFGVKVIAFMNLKVAEMKKKYGLKFVLEQTPAETTAYRFAKLDKKWFPEESKNNLQGDEKKGEIYYTNSTLLNVGAPIDPIERVKLEGIMHPLIEAGSITHIWLGEHKPSVKGLASLVQKIFENTTNDQVAFSPEFTSCNSCGKLHRGLKEKCKCGSKDLDFITRVTGYFSKVSMWNKGKIAELKDRNKLVNQKYFKKA